MKVIVSREIWATKGEDVVKLHELLGYACKGKHVILSDPMGAENEWLSTLDANTGNAYRRALDAVTRKAAKLADNAATVRIKATAKPHWGDPEAVLPLDEALKMLTEPLGILVENATNDWNFLLGIMLESQRKELQRAVENRWAEPIHGGGDTLEPQMQKRLKIPSMGLRTFVLFDSDRLHPDEFADAWTPDRPGHRPAACKAYEWEKVTRDLLPLRYWMLRRRFIESYMPKSELPEAQDKRKTPPDAVEAFFRMTAGQRWHYNMKEGFSGDKNRHDRERVGSLYEPLEGKVDDLHALQKGFGQSMAKHYEQAVERQFDWDEDARKEAAAAIKLLMRLL